MQFTENNIDKIKYGGLLFVAAFFIAISLRLYDLDNRPMHTDEAVHAVKYQQLLENNYYKYDPVEYHGPTLNYFTLPLSYLFGEKNIASTGETTLRLVPVLISILFLFIIYFSRHNIGDLITLISLILIGSSSVLIFYSRYYIQETLLVSFVYSAILILFSYFRTKKSRSLIVASIFIGLAFATKETSIISFGSAFISFVIVYIYSRKKFTIDISVKSVLIFLSVFILISILFYSSFFTNTEGISDSIKTFTNYFNKAGSFNDHIYPWYYYLELLFFTNNSLIFYTKLPILLLSIIGIFYSFKNKRNYFWQFISVFSIVQLVIYSSIPYKTPWLLINFWTGFLFLAGYGTRQLLQNYPKKRILTLSILVIIIIQMNYYNIKLNFANADDPQNPFTYSQPENDIIEISHKIIDIQKTLSEDELNLAIIGNAHDYWPLPWYLRTMPNTSYYNNIDSTIYKNQIILASPNFEKQLINALYSYPPPGKKNLYIPLFEKYLEIRPTIEFRGYIQNDIYQKYFNSLNPVSFNKQINKND
ncbi:MAG: TIGR03663 family protein [Melioribacteraceae bacterium]|nr:TIGR03663 family protein [Melioribacteraceae bacterium]